MIETLVAKPGYIFVNKLTNVYGNNILLGINDSINNWEEKLKSEVITEPELDNMWHENESNIQIKMSLYSNTKMLEMYPELALYRKQNNINSYITNENVYTYVNTLLDDHKFILEKYGALIFYK